MENNPADTAEDRFGRNVRRLREEAGLKQSDLAAKVTELGLKMHASTVAKIELRDVDTPRSVRINEAEAIAGALGVPLDHLLGGATEEARMVRAFFNILTRTQRDRTQIGVAVDEWMASKRLLDTYSFVVWNHGLDLLDEEHNGFRDVTYPAAHALLQETYQDVVNDYMESEYGATDEEQGEGSATAPGVRMYKKGSSEGPTAKYKQAPAGRSVKKVSSGERQETS